MVRHEFRNMGFQREVLEKVHGENSTLYIKIIDFILVVLLAPIDHLLKIFVKALN